MADQIKVVAGTINLKDPQSEHNVEKIIMHEKYDSSDSWRNDIALVKVSMAKISFSYQEISAFLLLFLIKNYISSPNCLLGKPSLQKICIIRTCPSATKGLRR